MFRPIIQMLLKNVVEENSTKSNIKCLGKVGKSFDNVVKPFMSVIS